MHDLNLCLEEKAAHLISNISITSDLFESAWDTIVNQYDNMRLLILT